MEERTMTTETPKWHWTFGAMTEVCDCDMDKRPHHGTSHWMTPDYANALEARVARSEAKAALADKAFDGQYMDWYAWGDDTHDVIGYYCVFCHAASMSTESIEHAEHCPKRLYDALDQGAQEETT